MAPKPKKKVFKHLNFASGRTVLKASFVVSVLFHGAMLLSIQKAFPLSWLSGPVQTFEVELLRPPIDPNTDWDEPGADIVGTGPSDEKTAQETEDTISLDTKDQRYSSYAKVIKQRLSRRWKYPEIARENLLEGEVLVLFSLNRDGVLLGIRILRSSQADILDTETLRTIRAAAPFPPFPGSVTVAKLNIKANFTYQLAARR